VFQPLPTGIILSDRCKKGKANTASNSGRVQTGPKGRWSTGTTVSGILNKVL
jgi:hypothetical protein